MGLGPTTRDENSDIRELLFAALFRAGRGHIGSSMMQVPARAGI